MKKARFFISLLGVMTLALTALNLWAETPEYVAEVTATRLFVRGGPATNYADLNVVSKGEKLVVVGEKSGWLKIMLPDDTPCWVSKKLVDEKEDGQGVVNAHRVNIRVYPDKAKSRHIIGQIKEGTEVTIIGEKSGWYKLEPPEGLSAWVSKKYTKFSMKYKEYLKVRKEEKVAKTQRAKLEREDQARFEEAEKLYEEIVTDVESVEFKVNQNIDDFRVLGQKFARAIALYTVVVKNSRDEDMVGTSRQRLNRLKPTTRWLIKTIEILDRYQKDKDLIIKKYRELWEQWKRSQEPSKSIYLAEGYIDGVGKSIKRPGSHVLIKGGEVMFYLRSGKKDLDLDDFFKKYVGIIEGDFTEMQGVVEKIIIVRSIERLK